MNLGLSIDVSDPNTIISLSGESVAHDGVNSIQKHYIFSNPTLSGAQILTLNFRDDELNGMIADDLALFHSSDGVDWEYVGGTVDIEDNSISVEAPELDIANGYWTAGIPGCADPI